MLGNYHGSDELLLFVFLANNSEYSQCVPTGPQTPSAGFVVRRRKGWQVHKDKKMRAQRGQEIEFVNEMVRQGVSPAPFRHPIDCMDFTTQVLDCSLPRKQALGLQRHKKDRWSDLKL